MWRETKLIWGLIADKCISIHSLRVEGDVIALGVPSGLTVFQSTPSVWRETLWSATLIDSTAFQSTPSVWRETAAKCIKHKPHLDFNPLPPCGGRLPLSKILLYFGFISIHSLRVEGDRVVCRVFVGADISIHSLRVEGDFIVLVIFFAIIRFQSTPSVWRETLKVKWIIDINKFQSTPSVWRETKLVVVDGLSYMISIHSLRVEGDLHVPG